MYRKAAHRAHGHGSKEAYSMKQSTFPNPQGVMGLTMLIPISNAALQEDFLGIERLQKPDECWLCEDQASN